MAAPASEGAFPRTQTRTPRPGTILPPTLYVVRDAKLVPGWLAEEDGGDAVKSFEIEVAVHRPLRALVRELGTFLSAACERERATVEEEKAGERRRAGPQTAEAVRVITTCQPSGVELVAWGAAEAAEKDRLLRAFCAFAEAFCADLRSLGYWADYADPASGLLMGSPGQTCWPEVQALERLRGYRVDAAGRCHIVSHPAWRFKHYPASLFAEAPDEVILAALDRVATRRAAAA